MSLVSKTILGCRVDDVTWEDIDTFCRQALTQNAPKQVVTVNGEFILTAQHDQEFKTIINTADLVIPDSTNVKWVGGLKAVTPGSDLTVRLSKLAAQTNNSVYLLGGWGEATSKAATKLQELAPGLQIAGISSADPDQEGIAAEIKRANADIVFVAYGAPNQDKWIHRHKTETGAKILVGVGGTFNMLAGTLPRAPQWVRAIHFEWLWRVILEPKRFKRAWNAVVVFPFKVLLG